MKVDLAEESGELMLAKRALARSLERSDYLRGRLDDLAAGRITVAALKSHPSAELVREQPAAATVPAQIAATPAPGIMARIFSSFSAEPAASPLSARRGTTDTDGAGEEGVNEGIQESAFEGDPVPFPGSGPSSAVVTPRDLPEQAPSHVSRKDAAAAAASSRALSDGTALTDADALVGEAALRDAELLTHPAADAAALGTQGGDALDAAPPADTDTADDIAEGEQGVGATPAEAQRLGEEDASTPGPVLDESPSLAVPPAGEAAAEMAAGGPAEAADGGAPAAANADVHAGDSA